VQVAQANSAITVRAPTSSIGACTKVGVSGSASANYYGGNSYYVSAQYPPQSTSGLGSVTVSWNGTTVVGTIYQLVTTANSYYVTLYGTGTQNGAPISFTVQVWGHSTSYVYNAAYGYDRFTIVTSAGLTATFSNPTKNPAAMSNVISYFC
jgi:hypothetical protein